MNAYDIKTGNPVPRQISPLEEGVWLMPGGSTDVEPPEFNKETHTCSFNGTKWVVEDIFRKSWMHRRLSSFVKTYELLK